MTGTATTKSSNDFTGLAHHPQAWWMPTSISQPGRDRGGPGGDVNYASVPQLGFHSWAANADEKWSWTRSRTGGKCRPLIVPLGSFVLSARSCHRFTGVSSAGGTAPSLENGPRAATDSRPVVRRAERGLRHRQPRQLPRTQARAPSIGWREQQRRDGDG